MLSNGQTWTLIGALIGLCTFVMGAMFTGLRSEMHSLRAELTAEIHAESADVRSEIAVVRSEMQGGFAVLGAQVAQLTDRVDRLEGR